MIAASGEGLDLARLLLDLLIILVAAKATAELAERIRVPAVLGEIVAGVLIGPSALGLVELGGSRGVSIGVLAEIGVLLLLLQVGMEMDLGELGKVGAASFAVGVIGVVAPFAGGLGVGLAFGQSANTAVFIGAALTATSVGITARVFGDLRALATTEARIVLGAAVADDVLGLVILTVVVKVVTGGDVGVGTVASTFGLALGFLALTGVVGVLAVPRALDAVHRRASSPAVVTVAAFAITLAFAELADAANLAFIIGAFMAGLGLGRSKQHDRIARDLGSVGLVLIPVFFAQIGINTDLSVMFEPSVLGLAGALCVVAIIGKLLAALGVFGQRVDRLLIGLGMIPRGEVGLIFASIGLANGVLDPDQYGALILMVLVTTVATPPLLRWRLGQGRGSDPDDRSDTDSIEPDGGWVTVSNGLIRLHGNPPVSRTVALALRTAALTANARPSGELLDWFGGHRTAVIEWTPNDTAALIRLLRDHDPKAWRLLDLLGVLERALPEVAVAMERRRADIGDLDPIGALRFAVLDRLDALVPMRGLPSDDLVLAGLSADVCNDIDDDSCVVQLLQRLVERDRAANIAALVADARLLRAGVRERDLFDQQHVLQVATHLGSVQRAREAHELAVALDPLPAWQRDALAELLRMLVDVLEHPEVTGSDANNLAAVRRLAAERLLEAEAPIERLRHASNTYLLTHEPDELARQARLIEPLPRAGIVRVSVTPQSAPDLWKIEVACRDTAGLLAHLTGVLADHQLDITAADLATWPDGAVLDSFIVQSSERPKAKDLAIAFQEGLRSRLVPAPMPTLELEFDNSALPWHTSVTVTGPDASGTLHSISAAFAAAGIVVHSARIGTTGGMVNDRFAVSDRLGRKLDGSAIGSARRFLANGSRRRTRVLHSRNNS